MRRRTLMRTVPAATSLPLAGCLGTSPGDEGDESDDTDEYPEEWRHVDPLASEYASFDAGAFDATAADPPEVGASLDGRAAWELVTETAWALRETSFQLAYDAYIVEGDHAGRWRWTLWRHAGEDVVYQRNEVERENEPDGTFTSYNDGTRYVAAGEGEDVEHFHVPDPHWHRDRVDSHLMMSFFQLLGFEVEDTVTVDGTELRRVRGLDAEPDHLELDSAAFFVGEDGIVRNAHADYESDREEPARDRYAVDGAVEITAGTPTIEEPEWIDDSESEEREPAEPA